MSDMFESLELNMRQEAERINPTKAILASQLECEQRFESFVAKNPERVDFLSDDIRSVADKYAAEYDIPSETIYEATVNHLKEAAVKKANPYVDPFAGKDEAHSDLINDYVGYNMDLDQIELYWNQYKPLVQSALQGGWNQDQNQLEMELEHLKNELEGIDSEEEGSDKYWSLEEQISKALSALYDSGVDHSLDEAAGTDLKEAAIKQAEWDKPWTEEDESKEEDEEDEESDSEEKKEEDEEEEKKESSVVKTANIDWQDHGDDYYTAKGPHGEWNIDPQSREEQLDMGLLDFDPPDYPGRRETRYQLSHIPPGYYEGRGGISGHDVRDVYDSLDEAFDAAHEYQSRWNERDERKNSSVREAKECNCWDGYKRVPGTKPCTPGSCEKCDADRKKKEAAIEEFLNLHEAALLPDWMRPKEMLRPKEGDLTWRELLQRSNLYKNPYFMGQGGQEEKDPTNPAASKGRPENKKRNMPAPLPEEGMGMGVIGEEEEDDVFSDLERIEADKARLRNVQQNTERFQRERDYAQKRNPRQKTFNEYEDQIRATGSVIEDLKEFYVAQGIPEKTASILVEAVGEMAQLQQNEPGLPAGASDPSRMSIDKEIGGSEGEKYKNLDVKQKQKELGLEHQDFTDFGEPVREFIQPGGEAPYSENTKDKEKAQATSDMNAKGVKQEDNAPKRSNASVKEADSGLPEWQGLNSLSPEEKAAADSFLNKQIQMEVERINNGEVNLYEEDVKNNLEHEFWDYVVDTFNVRDRFETHGDTTDLLDYASQTIAESPLGELLGINAGAGRVGDMLGKELLSSKKGSSDINLVPPEGVRSAARRGIKYHSEGKAGDGFESATLARAKKIAEGQELTPEHVKRMHSFFERHAGGRSQKAKKGEITPWDVAWLAWGGNAGRTWAAAKVKQIENAKTSANRSDEIEEIEKEIAKLKRGVLDGGYIYPGDDDIASDELADLSKRLKELKQENSKEGAAPLDFDLIDNEVEKLMSDGMTPEQAIQSLGVYDDNFIGWGSGSKR